MELSDLSFIWLFIWRLYKFILRMATGKCELERLLLAHYAKNEALATDHEEKSLPADLLVAIEALVNKSKGLAPIRGKSRVVCVDDILKRLRS